MTCFWRASTTTHSSPTDLCPSRQPRTMRCSRKPWRPWRSWASMTRSSCVSLPTLRRGAGEESEVPALGTDTRKALPRVQALVQLVQKNLGKEHKALRKKISTHTHTHTCTHTYWGRGAREQRSLFSAEVKITHSKKSVGILVSEGCPARLLIPLLSYF